MTYMEYAFLDGKIVNASEAKVSIFDRGFLYGDGVYETVRIYGGKIFRDLDHWKRLRYSLKRLCIHADYSDAYLTRICLDTSLKNGVSDAVARVSISRGRVDSDQFGYACSSQNKPFISVIILPVRKDYSHHWKHGVTVEFVSTRRNPIQSLDPRIKHMNCLNGILGKMESMQKNKDAFEGIFLNIDNYVAEGTISNIHLIHHGILKTPSLKCGLLNGISRTVVLQILDTMGIGYEETQLVAEDFYQADEVFITNSTIEVMPVVQIGGCCIGDGKIGKLTKQIHAQFRNIILKELQLKNNYQMM